MSNRHGPKKRRRGALHVVPEQNPILELVTTALDEVSQRPELDHALCWASHFQNLFNSFNEMIEEMGDLENLSLIHI